MKITNRPIGTVFYPNECPVCGKYTGGNLRTSAYTVVTDGKENIACCSKKCARIKIKEHDSQADLGDIEGSVE